MYKIVCEYSPKCKVQKTDFCKFDAMMSYFGYLGDPVLQF